MITLNIDPEGGITISQETAGERRVMAEHYASYDDVKMDETALDEERSGFFKRGWDAAIQECQVNFVNGRLPEFFNEIGAVKEDYSMTDISRSDLKTAQDSYGEKSEDPHHDEPEGTGEVGDDVPAAGWGEPERPADVVESIFAANEIGLNLIRPVADSGEPEQEKNQTWDPENSGTWTMSNEELQSRLDESYERGRRDGLVWSGRQTTKRSLDIIAVEINNRVLQAWNEEHSSDNVIQEPISKGEYARRFAVMLAERLGYEVQA